MAFPDETALRGAGADEALHRILEGTARVTGERFFSALVENLTRALDTAIAWVTEYLEPTRQLRSLAVWAEGRPVPNFLMDISGTPCEAVIRNLELVHLPETTLAFPRETPLSRFRPVSYMGVPLLGTDQRVLGNLAVLDTRPMPPDPRCRTILHIFAARASAELQRLTAERDLLKREEKYRRIVETAGEGFLLIDKNGVITDVNQAFCRMVGIEREAVIGRTPPDFSTISPDAFFLRKADPGAPGGDGIPDHYTFECSVIPATGGEIPVLVHGSVLRDDRGGVIGKMAFVADMTAHKKSLALAAEVQRSLVPRSTAPVRGFDVEWQTVSCDEVGGDYIDYFDGGDCGSAGFSVTVGDVMGHGVDAALMMMTARAFLRIHATRCQRISRLITELNQSFTHDARLTGRFMTLFHLTVDPARRLLRWVRAGHEPAVVFDPFENRFEEMKGPGMALGLDETHRYVESAMPALAPGQILALGTDGIWETRNAAGEMYGKERFRQVLRRSSRRSAGGILRAVFDDLEAFREGRRPDDDTSLVVIKADGFLEGGIDFQI